LAASVAAPLEDNYTLRAAKVRSRSRDGSSVGDALKPHFWQKLDHGFGLQPIQFVSLHCLGKILTF
jgi:hypothetical protein